MSTDVSAHEDAARKAVTAPDLPIFRFGLRQLLFFVTFICILIAAMATWHGVPSLVLLLAALIISGHVFSTALGTQLRSHADHSKRTFDDESVGRFSAGRESATAKPTESIENLQPRSPWHERRTPLPWLARLIGISFALGGLLGAAVLSVTADEHASTAGIVVGALSVAVLASWLAFVGYSFIGVFRHGVSEAMACERQD